MAVYINNIALADAYAAASTLGPFLDADTVTVLLSGNPVAMQFYVGSHWTDEREYVAPAGPSTTNSMRVSNVQGIRMRNANAGSVAVASATLFRTGVHYDSADPIFEAGALSPGTITATGSVTPGAGAVEVDHNGVPISTEPKLDFEDAGGIEWTITDDPAGTRAKIQRAVVPAGLIYNNVNLNLPNAAVTAMALNTAQVNQRGMFNAGQPGRLTAPVAGLYRFSARIWIAANGVGVERIGRLRENGVTTLDDDRKLPWAGDWNTLGVTSIVQMAVGEYVELCGFQDSGGALAVLGGAGITQLAGELIA